MFDLSETIISYLERYFWWAASDAAHFVHVTWARYPAHKSLRICHRLVVHPKKIFQAVLPCNCPRLLLPFQTRLKTIRNADKNCAFLGEIVPPGTPRAESKTVLQHAGVTNVAQKHYIAQQTTEFLTVFYTNNWHASSNSLQDQRETEAQGHHSVCKCLPMLWRISTTHTHNYTYK